MLKKTKEEKMFEAIDPYIKYEVLNKIDGLQERNV